jgi:hypothetical protein
MRERSGTQNDRQKQRGNRHASIPNPSSPTWPDRFLPESVRQLRICEIRPPPGPVAKAETSDYYSAPTTHHERSKLGTGAILDRQMDHKSIPLPRLAPAVLALATTITLMPLQASAAPTAEVAKRCIHFAYILYPFKKPGAAPASGAREAYFRDCLNKDGEVPEPEPPPKKP